MNKSKNIFEKIRLYRINKKRNKQEQDFTKSEENKTVIKKQSKIKKFFKTLLGLFIGIFEFLVMKSNKKNNENYKNNKVSTDRIVETKENTNENKKSNIEININKNINLNPTFSINKEISKEINIIKPKVNNNLQNIKEKIMIVEDQIIYADTLEELDKQKEKILVLKNQIKSDKVTTKEQLRENIIKSKSENYQNNNISENTNKIKTDNDKIYIQEQKENTINPIIDYQNFDLNKDIENKIELENKEIIENEEKTYELEYEKLDKRCDEDLELIDKKKNYIEMQKNYEKQLVSAVNNKENFKINKRDLRQIKNSVSNILAENESNLKALKSYMNMPNSSKMLISKMHNFFNSTFKLSFSIIPFLSFRNRLLGFTTSVILVNNSLKSYRTSNNTNYINQNIKSMISSKENCLRVGISNCKSSLSELDNIKSYLNSLPSEIKETMEYRSYLLDVVSCKKQIENQINTLQRLSKNYDDIKVKVKKLDY